MNSNLHLLSKSPLPHGTYFCIVYTLPDRQQAPHIPSLIIQNINPIPSTCFTRNNFPVHLTFPCYTKLVSEQVERPNIPFFPSGRD